MSLTIECIALALSEFVMFCRNHDFIASHALQVPRLKFDIHDGSLLSLSLVLLKDLPAGTDPDKDGLRYSMPRDNTTCFTYLALIICFMHFDWRFFVVSTFPLGQGAWKRMFNFFSSSLRPSA